MISTTIWRFSFIHCFHCSFAVLSLSAVASVLISLSFSTRLCSVLCHLVISSFHPIVETRRAIKFMQLFSASFFLLLFFPSTFAGPSSFDREPSSPILIFFQCCSVALAASFVVFGVFRLTPLTFHLELRPGQVAEKILRFFMTSFRSLSICCAESWEWSVEMMNEIIKNHRVRLKS